jgi:hypothetical protein
MHAPDAFATCPNEQLVELFVLLLLPVPLVLFVLFPVILVVVLVLVLFVQLPEVLMRLRMFVGLGTRLARMLSLAVSGVIQSF